MKNQILNNISKLYIENKLRSVKPSVPKTGKLRFDLAEGIWEGTDLASLPDRNASELKEKIGGYLNVETSQISVFAGADELIEIIPRLFLDRGDKVIALTPVFERILTTNKKVGVIVISFELRSDNGFSFLENELVLLIKKIKEEAPKILWFCSPVNPTGKVIDIKYIKKVADEYPGLLIVVDEAYQEYFSFESSDSAVNLINKNKNILVIRSFSKAFALAGARIGYAVADKDTISDLENYRTMYNVSTEAQKLAIKALSTSKILEIKSKISNISEEKKYIISKIKALSNYEIVEGSETNFIFMKHKTKDLFSELYQNGIVTGDWRTSPGVEGENYVRVSINKPKINKKLIDALIIIN